MRFKYLLVVLSFLLFPAFVKATNDINLNIDKTKLQIGEELNVQANINSDNKIYALTAELQYDNNVFEVINTNDFWLSEDWADIFYNSENHKFGLINKSGLIKNGQFLTFKLKVKEDANVGKTTISLNNIFASDAYQKITFNDAAETVLVIKDANGNETLPVEKAEQSIKTEKLIKTFPRRIILVTTTIFTILLIISCIIIYQKQIKNYRKIIICLGILGTGCLIFISILFGIDIKKKDVNNDGKTDYNDAYDVIKYLIDLQTTEEKSNSLNEQGLKVNNKNITIKKVKNNITENNVLNDDKVTNTPNNTDDYDVNGDGSIDVNDAASSTESATNKHYKVNLKEINKEIYYVEKQEEITLEFSADIEPASTIKKVVIDNQEYEVIANSSSYSVKLIAPNKAGVHNFNFSKVILDNGREVSTDLKIKVEILKSKPKIQHFEITPNNDGNDLISFEVNDPDSALIKANIKILDAAGESVVEEDIKSKENTLQYKFIRDTKYSVIIMGKYDLDTDEFNKITGEKNEQTEELLNAPIEINSSYEFEVNDITLTKAVEKNESPILTFKSKNNVDYKVAKLVLTNNEEYDVIFDEANDLYKVILNGLENAGTYQIDIAKLVLETGIVFVNTVDFTIEPLEYVVLKSTPKIEITSLKDNPNTQEISANILVEDPDKVLKKVTVKFMDTTKNNEVFATKTIENLNDLKNISFTYSGLNRMKYQVVVYADYDLADENYSYQEKELARKEISVEPNIYIENISLKKNEYQYPQKEQIIYVDYKIVVPADLGKAVGNMVTGITINGLNYTALRTKVEDTTAYYTVSFKAPNTSGLYNIDTNMIMFIDGSFYTVNDKSIQIDVLRDKPWVENFEVLSEDYIAKEVTYAFDIKEEALNEFKNGQLLLNGDVVSRELKIGHNEITVENVLTDQNLNLKILADYDLDTNTLDQISNYKMNEEIFANNYGLYDSSNYENAQIINFKPLSKYYDKDEQIKLQMQLTGLSSDIKAKIAKVIINNKKYPVTFTDDNYYMSIEGYANAGIKNIRAEEIVLTSGQRIKLKNKAECSVDILKTPLTIQDFAYEDNNQNVIITMNKKDEDNSLIGNLIVKIFDEDNHQIGSDYIYNGQKISFAKDTNVNRYYIKVYGTYDLDSEKENENYYPNALLLNEVASFEINWIEIRDITDIVLYNQNNEIVKNIKKEELDANLNNYFVKISMSKMPDIYSNILRAEINEEQHLILVLDYDGKVAVNGKEVKELKVDYGQIKEDIAQNDGRPDSFASLIEKIKAHPEGTYELDHDLDASDYNVDSNWIIDETFTGTIKGNGYTIKNLNVSLFQKTDGAVIQDLKFTNVKLKAGSKGIIADGASHSTIKQILVDSFEKRGGVDGSGALIGRADNQTIIEECRVIRLQLYNGAYNQVIGGIVGRLNNATVRNCYVSGISDAGWHFIGGIAGIAENNATIENCYSKLTMSFSFEDNSNGGIAVAYGAKAATLKNNVSLSTANFGYGINAGEILEGSINNYQIEESKFKKNEGEAYQTISQNAINEDLFKQISFSEEIWNLDNSSYDNPPTLKIEKVKIPNSDEIKEHKDYEENKEILYRNLYQLNPYADSTKIVKNGINVHVNDILNKQEIKQIIPIDKDGNLITYLTKSDYKKIDKVKLIFKNEEARDYEVTFDKLNGSIVNYRLKDLKIDYTFNHYMLDENADIVNNLVAYLNNLDYQNDFEAMTQITDSRLYKDYYNEVTKQELKEFVLKYLSTSNNANFTGNKEISKHIENDLIQSNKLKKALMVYNYFKRWYGVEINNIKLDDLVFFNSTSFNEVLTPDNITNNFFNYEANFETDHTNNTYNRIFKPYTNINDVTGFIEYLIKVLTNNNLTADKWFADTFKGYLLEINIENRPDITYTAWSHIRSTWQNYALVILTLPKNSTYILSSPTQYLIGSQRTYVAKPDTFEGATALDNKIKEYAVNVKRYYTTAAGIINDASYFNAIHNVQIDHRFTLDENGVTNYQSPYVTEEGFHKNFSEPLNQFTNDNGTAAGANGSQVKYVAYAALNAYGTWSHESAHNQDARLFLLNNGRRWDAGGEDYADGNLSQRWSSGEISMNISIEHGDTYKNSISTNLSPSRIDTQEEIKDFYSKLFDTYYILDYLEAQAFVQLTPEQQAALAFKISYKNIDSTDIKLRYKTTQYTKTSSEEYAQMALASKGLGLKAVESLYDNMLTVYPGMPKAGNYYGDNKYGAEKLQKTRWYAPFNNEGRPDSYSLKLFAYEMLGYKGYIDGYVEYYSNIHADANGRKTDLMALQKITGNDNITFKQYRMERFKKAEEALAYVKYINANEFVEKMYQAFQSDAEAIINAEANGSQNNNVYNLPNSSQVKMDAYYALKNGTNDFVDDIYSLSALRIIDDFKVNK